MMKICCAVLFSLISFAAVAAEIRTAAQNSAPKYFKNSNDQMVGLCVEILKSIEAKAPEFRFVGHADFKPFSRIKTELKRGELDVFIGFSKNEQREKDYYFSPPLYRVNYTFATRKGETWFPDTLPELTLSGSNPLIAALFGTADIAFLEQHMNGSDIVKTQNLTSALHMLVIGRVRFVYYHDLGLAHSIKQVRLTNRIHLSQKVYRSASHYLAYSKKLAPEVRTKLEGILLVLIQEGRLLDIANKYITPDLRSPLN